MPMIVRLEPWGPAQADFVFSQDRFTAFIGGIGAGKTKGGAIRAARWLGDWGAKPSVGVVVAPTYRMLADATLRTYRELLQIPDSRFNKSDFIARIGQAEILFRSADDPEHLRGPNIHWAHMDEPALCGPMTFDIMLGRLRADGTAGPLWLTGTPKGRNWVYEKVQAKILRMYHAKTRDNPHLAREFVDSLERAYTGPFAKQELDAEFVAFEGLVYDEFRREIHVKTRDAGEFGRFIVCCDEGYTNPAVALVVGLDSDDRAHILSEFYQRRVLQATFVDECRRLAEQYHPDAIYVDPSAAGLIAEMQSANIPVYPANNAVSDGIQAVKRRLAIAGDGLPRLTVDLSCVNTIAEFESYVWAKDKDGKALDKPEKQNDHAMDSDRYGILSNDKRPTVRAW